MNKMIEELYKVFKKYKLAPDFASRCSPYSQRQEVAKYLENTPLPYIELEPIDYYCFKAISTMGDEQDLKYFLPRLIEFYVTDRGSYGDCLFRKLKMSGFEQWETVEQKLIYNICEQYFILKLNGQIDVMLSSLLDDYVELFDLETFYEIWLNCEKETALDHFFVEAEYQCIPKAFYWKYLDKLEAIYLETTDLKLKKKLDKFLDQHQSYLKDLYL